MKRARPRQHKRHLRSGKTITVNKGRLKVFNINKVRNKKELASYIKDNGIRVVNKEDKDMYGFAGLHEGDGDAWGINIPHNTIWVNKSLKGRENFEIARHEVEEMDLVKHGMDIWPAHKIAMKHEKVK